MALLNWVFEQPAWERLTLTLLHSLWQGALLAVLLWMALRLAPAGRTGFRYVMSVTALAGLVVSCAVTHALLTGASAAPADQRGMVVSVDSDAQSVLVGPASLVRPPPVAPSSPSTSSTGRDAPEARWPMVVGIAWMTGALLMLLRALFVLHAASRLRRAGVPLTEPWVLDLLADLCQRMRIRRRMELLICEPLRVPGVVGAFWPAILIPPAVLADLSPEQVRLILAHELAHVRRHDFFVNVLQLLIEAALFFNPAMWWMSRQVRIEREARCDQAAAALAPQPSDYARALADIVMRLVPSREPAVLSMSGHGDPAGLLTRAERLLRPQRRPRVAVPWHGMIGVMLAGLVVLGGLWEGTHVAVAAAKSIRLWTAEERVAAAKAIEGPSSFSRSVEHSITVRGRIEVPEIDETTTGIELLLKNQNESGTTFGRGHPIEGNEFAYVVQPGFISAVAMLNGKVIASAPAIHVRPDNSRIDLVLTPEPLFSCRVQVVDEMMGPISGAAVYGGPSRMTERLLGHTDQQGILRLPQCDDNGWDFRVTAAGWREATRSVVLRPDSINLISMKPTYRASGIVVDRATGVPIAGAAVKIVYADNSVRRPDGAPVIARTDASGRFSLDQLSPTGAHIWIDVPGKAPAVAAICPGQDNVRIVLEPEIVVTGELDGLQGDFFSGDDDQVQYHHHHRFGGQDYVIRGTAQVTTSDGRSRFTIEHLNAGKLRFHLAGILYTFAIDEPAERIVVKPPIPTPQRKVILLLHPPQGSPPVEGSCLILSTNMVVVRDLTDGRPSISAQGQIEAGRAEFMVPVGARVMTLLVDTPGYAWNLIDLDIPVGKEPLIVERMVDPAGTIHGHLSDPSGQPVAGERLTLFADPPFDPEDTIRMQLSSLTAPDGSFLFHGLPLGREYGIFIQRAEGTAYIPPRALDGQTPILDLPITLQSGAGFIRGRVLDADGQPPSNATVSLNYETAFGTFPGGQTKTDWAGFYTFSGVADDVPGTRVIEVAARPGWQPTSVRVKPGRQPEVAYLVRGHVLRGVVLNASGEPMFGGRMVARPAAGGRAVFADAPINVHGEFVFTSLDRGVYGLVVQFSDLDAPAFPMDPIWTINVDSAAQPLVLTFPFGGD